MIESACTLRSGTCRVSVIIPTLNEVENIDDVLQAVLAQRSQSLDIEVLVADGGSSDGTISRVHRWEVGEPVRLVAGGGRGGLAADVLYAASMAAFPVIVVMDADFSHDPKVIPQLVGPIAAGAADMVIGSRYVPGGSTPDWPLRRRFLSRAGGLLALPLTDVADPMSGFFAVRRALLQAVDPAAAGFKIALEIIAAGADRIRVAEIPITFLDRVRGTSKITFFQMLAYAKRLVALSGGSLSFGSSLKFASVGAIGFALDLLVFEALYMSGVGLAVAHTSSFLIVTAFNYVLNSRWSFKRHEKPGSDLVHYLRFLAVCLLALLLRGGVIVGAINAWGADPKIAILFGVLAAAAVNYAGIVFYVFPSSVASVSTSVRMRIAAIGAFFYVVALRLAFMGTLNLMPEEAYYWNYAQHLDIGYLDHPPVIAWLIALGNSMAGTSEFAVRLAAPLCWLIATVFCFGLAKNLFDRNTAIISILLMSVLPFFFSIGLLMTPDAPLTAAWAAALFSLERALLGGRKLPWLGVGAALGVGMISKYTIVLLCPALLVYLVVVPAARRCLLQPWPYLGAAIALLLFSPILIWNAQHEWASFAFQGQRRLEGEYTFSLHVFIASMAALLTPVGLLAAAYVLFPSRVQQAAEQGRNERWLFTTIFTGVPLAVFAVFSVFHEVKLNWTGPVWLALLPSLAYQLSAVRNPEGRFLARLRRLWMPTVVGSLMVYGVILNIGVAGLPGSGLMRFMDPRSVPSVWAALGHEANLLTTSIAEPTGQRPILVGMDKYFLSSELAFYATENGGTKNTAGRSLFGAESLMYNFWVPPRQVAARDMLLIAFNRSQLESTLLPPRFAQLGPIEERSLFSGESRIGRFYYRVGRGYEAREGFISNHADSRAPSPG